MLRCVQIIKEAKTKNESVLVNCLAGVNRSCSAIVAYAMLETKYGIKSSTAYIEKMKAAKHDEYIIRSMGTAEQGMWDTMTNTSFIRHLMIMISEQKE